MITPESIAARLEESFVRVHEERMQGIPLLNAELSVQAVGFHRCSQGILGALITPWFMNLILLPPDEEALTGLPIGLRQEIELPARKVRFTVNELDGIGLCYTHSLFSPVNCFHTQESAVKAAQEALAELAVEAEPVALTEQEEAIERYMRKEAVFEPREIERTMNEAEESSPAEPEEETATRNLSRRELLFAAFREQRERT